MTDKEEKELSCPLNTERKAFFINRSKTIFSYKEKRDSSKFEKPISIKGTFKKSCGDNQQETDNNIFYSDNPPEFNEKGQLPLLKNNNILGINDPQKHSEKEHISQDPERDDNEEKKVPSYGIGKESFYKPKIINDKEREEIKKLFNLGFPSNEDYVLFYFGKAIDFLEDNQIIKLAEEFGAKFANICVNMAERVKDLIITEYSKIRGIKKVSLTSIFSFDLLSRIRKVERRENVVLSVETLNEIKSELDNYKSIQKTSTQKILVNDYYEECYKKIFDFIDEHIEFSEYIKQRKGGNFKISDLKFIDDTDDLELRSWLIENLRYAFPKKYELPLDNNLLSWFLFGDHPCNGETSIINTRLNVPELWRRFLLRDLLAIDYRVSKLVVQDFNKEKIKIDQADLDYLQKKVTFLIYYYIFYKENKRPYVSSTTKYGTDVGKEFWTPEYFLIRSVFFATAESNQGTIKDFNEIGINSNVWKMQDCLREGAGFGDSFTDVLRYIGDLCAHMPLNSNKAFFKMALRNLEEYDLIYFLRSRNLKASISPYDSNFEKEVHEFLLKISSLFQHHKTLIEAIGKRMITINIDNIKTIKKINYILHYDFYLKLNDKIRKCLGLDNKWKGIAVEANGSYWHSQYHSEHLEHDIFKKVISKAENIVLVEIWDNMDSSLWLYEIVKQLNYQTNLNLIEKDFLSLANC